MGPMLLCILFNSVSSALLAVHNAGFEIDTMPNGDPILAQTYFYGSPIITNWQPYDPHSNIEAYDIGVLNPTHSGQYMSNEPFEGNLNGFIWSVKPGQGEIGILRLYRTIFVGVVQIFC